MQNKLLSYVDLTMNQKFIDIYLPIEISKANVRTYLLVDDKIKISLLLLLVIIVMVSTDPSV